MVCEVGHTFQQRVLVGGTGGITFSAVLCKCLLAIRFVMGKSFHADGYKKVGVVVMMSVEMCMGGYTRVSIGLA